MSSIIEGYNYDIFISYRQKDNKHDSWVTDFVDNLKGELESTFKEEISVYFDINPHDGLLETYDVDESLKEKLKCLVFIPIISRTYCDPKSFAWEHEFRAFIELASHDKYGLKVMLPGGNVAGRVLPVQIHDLDDDDRKLVEDQLGGHLRGIEFIYKEQGVDRPLRAEDKEEKNLNRTSYRNQVNKVSLAVREIITSMKHSKLEQGESQKEINYPAFIAPKYRKTRIIAGLITAVIIIAVGLLMIPKLFKSPSFPDKSIAVLPFRNDSPDPENEYFCNGILDEILNQLQKIGDLKVKSRVSSERYRDPGKDIKAIGRELGVSLILEGSVRKIDDDIRIAAQLIDARTGDQIWSDMYEGKYTTEIFDFQSKIAKTVASSLNAVITPQEEKRIDARPATNMLVYDLTSRGHEMIRKYRFTRDSIYFKMAMNLFDQALEIDSANTEIFACKGLAYIEIGNYDSAMYCYRKASIIDPNHTPSGLGYLYWRLDQPDSAYKYALLALEQAPNDCWLNLLMGQVYSSARNEIIKGLPYFQKAYDNDGESVPEINVNVANEYFRIGDYQKAAKYLRQALFLRLECSTLSGYCMMLCAQGKYYEAFHSLDSVCSIATCDQECSMTRFHIYLFNKEFGKAEESLIMAGHAGYKQNDRDDLFIAYLYSETGRREEALSLLNRSIKLNEDLLKGEVGRARLASLAWKLAVAYAVLGDNKNVIRYLSEYERSGSVEYNYAIRLIPWHPKLSDDPEVNAIVKRIEDKQSILRAQVREMELRGEITL